MPLKIKLVDLIANKKTLNPEMIPLYSNYFFEQKIFDGEIIGKIIETFDTPHYSNSKFKVHLNIINPTHEHYLWFTENQFETILKPE